MLTLESDLTIPPGISFTNISEGAILLNTRTNQYFALDETGARLWALLLAGNPLRGCHAILLTEYAVEPAVLERDLLELLETLRENGLVEFAEE